MLGGELTPKIKEEPDYSSDEAAGGGGYGDEEEDDSDSAVVTLTNDNFDEVVSPTTDAMLEFYAPWCGHCQQLKPVYKALPANSRVWSRSASRRWTPLPTNPQQATMCKATQLSCSSLRAGRRCRTTVLGTSNQWKPSYGKTPPLPSKTSYR